MDDQVEPIEKNDDDRSVLTDKSDLSVAGGRSELQPKAKAFGDDEENWEPCN